jgi:hypothetical protein
VSEPNDLDDFKRELIFKVKELYREEYGAIDVKSLVIHPGPKVWKVASTYTTPDARTGEIKRRRFKVETFKARPRQEGGGYDFTNPAHNWSCDGVSEVEALKAFLNNEFPSPGNYLLIRRDSETGRLISQIDGDEPSAEHLAMLLRMTGCTPDLVNSLASSPSGALLAEAVELQRRRSQLDELRAIVEHPGSTERDHIHPQLKKMGWIFGGRYVGASTRRQLTTGDVLDIPLLRPDGSLHIVELKGANIPDLVHRHRGPGVPHQVRNVREEIPLVVGASVHHAVGQAMNYLCHLDEERDRILAKLKIETRRAPATVLIGHPAFVKAPLSDDDITGTLRIYNSHLARIEVITYKDIIENAERALALAAEPDELVDEILTSVNAPSPQADFSQQDPWAENVDPWAIPDQDSFSGEPPF